MTDVYRFMALDLGAESGRGELVTLREGKVELEELHRFPNRPVTMAGTLHWDFPALYAESLAALRVCAERGIELTGIGVDTWGVDFGLLDRDGRLLGLPVHYRDGRTENIHEYARDFMSLDDVFQATALEPWQISTLFQLLAMRRDKSPLLEMAETMLMTPDLVHYFLTGVKACERSIVQTGNLIGTDCQWCWDVIDRFQLPRRIFPKLIGPAEVVGPLQPAVRDDVGLGDVPVIASCGHDTSAAVAAVPGEGDGWAFLSCGTWSILGTVLDTPVTDLACLRAGFTNEYSVGGWFLAKNILGLWLVQQLRAKWDKSGDPWDYPRMTAQAEAAPPGPIVHAVDDSLLAPPDMESALLALLSKTGQSAPESRGQLVRCVLESLALEYSTALDAIGELTGRRPQSVYMVGGGTANKLLCQLTADACGVGVRAGVDQCTAIGNALGQAIALGIIQDVGQARQVVRNSFELASYEPQDASIWQEKRARYRTLSG